MPRCKYSGRTIEITLHAERIQSHFVLRRLNWTICKQNGTQLREQGAHRLKRRPTCETMTASRSVENSVINQIAALMRSEWCSVDFLPVRNFFSPSIDARFTLSALLLNDSFRIILNNSPERFILAFCRDEYASQAHTHTRIRKRWTQTEADKTQSH